MLQTDLCLRCLTRWSGSSFPRPCLPLCWLLCSVGERDILKMEEVATRCLGRLRQSAVLHLRMSSMHKTVRCIVDSTKVSYFRIPYLRVDRLGNDLISQIARHAAKIFCRMLSCPNFPNSDAVPWLALPHAFHARCRTCQATAGQQRDILA